MKKMLVLLLISLLAFGAVGAQEDGGELEIFSWWAGNEGPALEALIDLYTEQNPNVEVINATVTGGSGVNARAVLKTRMLGGDPPSSFQVHAGEELRDVGCGGPDGRLDLPVRGKRLVRRFPGGLAGDADLRGWHLQRAGQHSPLQRDVV